MPVGLARVLTSERLHRQAAATRALPSQRPMRRLIYLHTCHVSTKVGTAWLNRPRASTSPSDLGQTRLVGTPSSKPCLASRRPGLSSSILSVDGIILVPRFADRVEMDPGPGRRQGQKKAPGLVKPSRLRDL